MLDKSVPSSHAILLPQSRPPLTRALVFDSGRRFFPVDTLVNIMDTMAANKLNVLHLHASDECRFGVTPTSLPH